LSRDFIDRVSSFACVNEFLPGDRSFVSESMSRRGLKGACGATVGSRLPFDFFNDLSWLDLLFFLFAWETFVAHRLLKR